jgi:hypothetical protein
LYENKAYAFGGLNDTGTSIDSIEYYNNEHNRWIELPLKLPYLMDSFRIIPGDENHTLLLVGGRKNHVNSREIIDFRMTDGTYLYHSTLNTSRINPKILTLGGDYIVFGGGISQTFGGNRYFYQNDMTELSNNGLLRKGLENLLKLWIL